MKRQDYIETLFSTGLIMISTIVLYKLSGYLFGALGFSEFSLVKRIIAFLIPLFALGMGVGVPREVARANVYAKHNNQYSILGFATLIIIIVSVAFIFIIWVFAKYFSALLFSSEQYAYLVIPLGFTVFGLLLNAIVYSYLRGLNQIRASNIFLLLNTGLLPLLVIFVVTNIANYFLCYGVILLVINLLVVLIILNRKRIEYNRKVLKKFFVYSISRVPGDVALEIIFVIPPILAGHFSGIGIAGSVSFGLALMHLIMTPLQPLNVLLLPHVVRMLKEETAGYVKTYINKMLLVTLVFSVFFATALFLGASSIIYFFAKQMDSYSIYVIQNIAIASVPFSIYIVLRSVIDAASYRAYNAINMVLSLIIYFISILILSRYFSWVDSVVNSMVVAFYVLGLLTYFRVRSIIKTQAV